MLAWVATDVRSVALVGQLLLAISLTSLITSAVAGPWVDRRKRLPVIRTGQSIRVAASVALVAGLGAGGPWIVPALATYAVVNALGLSINSGALDGVLQALIRPERRVTAAIRLSIVRQAGLAVGTGLAGLVLHAAGSVAVAAAMGAVAMAQLALAGSFARGLGPPPHDGTGESDGLRAAGIDGLRQAAADRPLAAAMLGVALTFSVAQMTNMLAPGFVRDALRAGSDVYGLMEAAWAVGGGAILALAGLGRRAGRTGGAAFLGLAVLGALMLGFAATRSVPAAVALYAAMGALFALTRAICDGRLLERADPARIGRVRAATTMLTSGFGIAIYLLPSVVLLADIAVYYQIWGVVIVVAGLGLALMVR
ncbi:MAG: MFS transporter [Alphaproteobacteria bacterium]|nr:MFS transporter [Alphaproteobacteria bacterium]